MSIIKSITKSLLLLLLSGVLISLNLQFVFLGGAFLIFLENEYETEHFIGFISPFILPFLLFDYVQNVFYGYSFLTIFLILIGFKALMLLFHTSKIMSAAVLFVVVFLALVIWGLVGINQFIFSTMLREDFLFILGYLLTQWVVQKYDV